MTRPHALVLGLLVAATALVGCREQHVTASATLPPVQTEIVQGRSQSPHVRYSADITPREQVTLAFKVGGYVHDLLEIPGADGRYRKIQQGDHVSRGAVLARITETDYAQRRDQSLASLQEADAALQKAETDFARAKTLYESQSLTKPDFDAAKTNLEVSVARRQAASVVVEQGETTLKDTALTAPFDGVVLKRSVEVGTLATAGTPAFVLADVSAVKAVFGVPDAMMRRASIGLPISITTEAFGTRSFPGRITAISPAADSSSRVFDVELTVPNPNGMLSPGMIATVEVPETDEAAIDPTIPAVPLRAIIKTPGSAGAFSVFVVEQKNGKQIAQARVVQVGDVAGNQIALTQGLKIGEQVVVSGAAQLVDGEEVRIIPQNVQ